MMPVRLKDIAEKTGYSINTVSLALKASTRISTEAREIITDTAKSMNYVPNKIARSLVTNRSDVFGFVVPKYSNFVSSLLASQFERMLSAMGYSMLLVSTKQAGERRVLDVLRSQRVAGIFMFPMLPPDFRLLEYVQKCDTPFVFLSYGRDYELVCDAVYTDREQASYIVTKHLIEMGHRRIGFISSSFYADQPQVDAERYRGHVAALSESGVPYDPEYSVIPLDSSYADGYNAAKTLMNRTGVTAIYGANDPLAVGAMAYCLSHGFRVPEDISFASNDSTDAAAYAPVSLTASIYPIGELTQRAIGIMMERIEKKRDAPFQRIPLHSTLDVRKSVFRVGG